MRIGLVEVLLILAVVVLIFGATRIPQTGDALGRAIRSIRGKSETVEPKVAEKKTGTSGS